MKLNALKRIITAAVLSAAIMTMISEPVKAVTPELYYFGGHTYAFMDAKDYDLDSYSATDAFCRHYGGHLAVINDENENEYLFSILKQNYTKTAFFGYSDQDAEGYWKWSGDDSSYENWTDNWDQHQPDNGSGYGGDEDYAEFNYEKNTDSINDGTWNDAPFMDNTSVFICEWEYEIDNSSPEEKHGNGAVDRSSIVIDYLRYRMDETSMNTERLEVSVQPALIV